VNQKTSPCDERVLEARIRSQPGPRCPGWPLGWAKFVSPPGGSVAGLRFVTALSCGGRPQLCQLHPPLALLRVVCLLSDVLAVQREPVKQIGQRHDRPLTSPNLIYRITHNLAVAFRQRRAGFAFHALVTWFQVRRGARRVPGASCLKGTSEAQRAPRFLPKSPASECTNPVKFGKEGPVVVPLSTTFSEGGLIP
jgi:hypothetical protein